MRKMFLIVLSLLACSCGMASDINGIEFDSVYRVTKKIDGATNVGINYADFSELIQDFSAVIEIAKDKVSTEKEQQLLLRYEGALECYVDSLTLWRMIIRYDIDNPYKMEGSPGKEILELVTPILNKYNIEPEREVFESYGESVQVYIVPKLAVQKIWLKASSETEEANRILLGKQ